MAERKRSVALRAICAVIGLEALWLVAAEAWRESSPTKLAVFLATVWLLVAIAWRVLLPLRHAVTAGLVAALLVADVAIDLVSPYPPRFAFVVWEAARAVAIVAATAAATRILGSPPARARTAAESVARVSSLVVAALIPGAMAYIAVTGAKDEAGPADAALVLGFALDDDGKARPQLIGRMNRAADLVKRGFAPRLILSGGAAKAGHTEAGVMRELALERSVPADALILDELARSTIENFACARPLLEKLGARRVLVVTEPWHMRRAMLLARRHGLDARAAPADSEIWRSARHAGYWLFRDANAFVIEAVRNAWAAPGRCAAAECEGCRKF